MEILTLPFMQKAIAAGLVLGLILPFLGVFATLRRMSFFGDGIAHASLAGIAIGVVAGFQPFFAALAIGVLFGIGVYLLERKTNLASDAIIGLMFTTGLAVGIVLLSLQRGYQPELISFLFGNILAIGNTDLLVMGAFAALIFGFLVLFLRQLTLMTFDRDTAWLSGISVGKLELVFYIILSVAIVLGVKLLGIILVSALLIIPPTTAKLFASSFQNLLFWSIIAGELSIMLGLVTSYFLDLPSGATIILMGSLLFFCLFFFRQIASLLQKQ